MESSKLPHCAPAPVKTTHEAPGERDAPNLFKSESLFNGNKSVAIEHNGAIYRLQATKLGKLILTK